MRSASRRPSGLGVLSLMLALLLAAAAAVQVRQFALTERALGADDYSSMGLAQVEIEYWRLRDEWTRAMAGQTTSDDALRLRYEIWVSRVGLSRAPAMTSLLGGPAEAGQRLAALESFIERADPHLASGSPPGMPGNALAELWPALKGLADGLHNLTVDTAHEAARRSEQRDAIVRSRTRLGAVLMGLLLLLSVAFALMVRRHVRQLRARQGELETLAERLQREHERAEEANQAKSRFLADMSHGIRTPLQGVLGMLALLRESGLNVRQADYARTANESAEHLLTILNDLLDLSRLDTGGLALRPAPTDPRQLVHEVETLMRSQAAAKSLSLHVDVEPTVPERVMIDAVRVKQVLYNLVHNAIRYSARGSVVIDVRTTADQPARLCLVVTDSGDGMDEATRVRLNSNGPLQHGPTTDGLGLEISRKLADLMGATLSAQSTPGEGSIVRLELPLVPAAPASPLPQAARLDEGARSLRVLVAEDHAVNRRYLSALLESLHHESHFVADGGDAVEAARQGGYDLILMDLHMPTLDGLAATKQIRALADRAAATVPIIALTADAFAETRERCLLAGMNDFLAKPVSPADLAGALRRLFGKEAVGMLRPPRPDPSMPPLTEPPSVGLLDMASVEAALAGVSRGRLATLIDEFLEQGPDTVERFRHAVRDGQPLELRVHAHSAAGAALNLGLAALAGTAQALHEGAAHLPAHEIARLVQRYEELLPLTRRAASDAGLL